MSSFDNAKAVLFEIEGGYANNSEDYGGETKYGISKRQYPLLDIRNLTFDKACIILQRDYWDRYRISEINNQDTANKVFLAVINMNPLDAVKCVQKAINSLHGNVMMDGVLGSITLRIINILNDQQLIDKLRIELARNYLKKVQLDKTQLPNLPSWLRRALL